MLNSHQGRAARRRSYARRATLLTALCLALSGCASQQAASGLRAKLTDDPGCRELLNQVDRWEVQRAQMFLGGTEDPYNVKCVASGGDTVIAMVPPKGNRIAVLTVTRGPGGRVGFIESVFGIRIRAGEWQLSHDIDGEALEANGGMAPGRNYQGILERVWETLPHRR